MGGVVGEMDIVEMNCLESSGPRGARFQQDDIHRVHDAAAKVEMDQPRDMTGNGVEVADETTADHSQCLQRRAGICILSIE